MGWLLHDLVGGSASTGLAGLAFVLLWDGSRIHEGSVIVGGALWQGALLLDRYIRWSG